MNSLCFEKGVGQSCEETVPRNFWWHCASQRSSSSRWRRCLRVLERDGWRLCCRHAALRECATARESLLSFPTVSSEL